MFNNILGSLICGIGCLIPTWLYMLSRVFFSPEGFWQNLVITIIFVYFLGLIQVILIGVLIWMLIKIWE